MFENIKRDYKVHKRSDNIFGFYVLLNYRFGNWCDTLPISPLRWIGGKLYGANSLLCEIITGSVLERRTKIGKDLHLVHRGSINIHSGAVIGDRLGVMHGVTIGVGNDPGVPTIGNDVFIGANATVIGGITIGDNVTVAANSLVINDVPANRMAIGVPAKIFPKLMPKKTTDNS